MDRQRHGFVRRSVATPQLTVTGPVSEVATFTSTVARSQGSPAVTPGAGSGAGLPWVGGWQWIAVAVGGLVGALGVVQARRRPVGPATPAAASAPESATDSGDGIESGGELPESVQVAARSLALEGAQWTWSVPAPHPSAWESTLRTPSHPAARPPVAVHRLPRSDFCSTSLDARYHGSSPVGGGFVGSTVRFHPAVDHLPDVWAASEMRPALQPGSSPSTCE